MNPGKGSLNQTISFVVRGDVQCLHEIEAEICRWEDILRIEYVRYMRGDTEYTP